MRYSREKTSAISFPMGGIGAGCIGLAGNGHLVDWEIFNQPNKFSFNGFTHFAVRSEKDGAVEDYRILQGDWPPPYSGEYVNMKNGFVGFGWGPFEETLASWPHFGEHEFEAVFPVARIRFGREKLPADVSLTGWSVLIPGNSCDSSLPAAFIEVTLTASEERDFTVLGVMDNPWKTPSRCNRVEGTQLTAYQGEGGGEVTLSLDEPLDNISFQTEPFRGQSRDHKEKYCRDVMTPGRLNDRRYDTPRGEGGWLFGILASHFHLRAGETRTVRFVITWHCTDNCTVTDDFSLRRAREQGVPPTWVPWYTTRWPNSRASGSYAVENLDRLREETFRFRDAMAASTLPPAVLDGATACLSVLKSPTCLRLQDGTFWGWEGVGIDWGSCPGSCAHVWNYAQALPFLFPDLERSMRVSHLKFGVDEFGGHHFRIGLPLGVHALPSDFRACADGQFGEIMKFYREWRLCGDDDFLRQWWPTLRKMMEYAWSEANPDKWDPAQSGVLTGWQHHTLDLELIGPNVWLTGFYLGALKAMARMAEHLGELEFSRLCTDIFERGRRFIETSGMFNGEFFVQCTDLKDRSALENFKYAGAYSDAFKNADAYWDAEAGQIKYQIGEGCIIDQHLAQWFATMYGLGELYSPEMNRKSLQAVYKYNFKTSMAEIFNVWRTYSLNDEGGVMICTWPNGGRPEVPIMYHSETMTGFEWALAAHLAAEGFFEQCEAVAAAVRDRFDGRKRNPWNEIECGSNYARSMAAFGLFNSYSRFTFGPGEIGFNPSFDMTVFWSTGAAWGTFTRRGGHGTLRIVGGRLELNRLVLPFASGGEVCFSPARTFNAGDSFDF